MRVVLQRVSRASVTIDGRIAGTVERGFCLLVGLTHGDTEATVDWMAEKVTGPAFAASDRLTVRKNIESVALDSRLGKSTSTGCPLANLHCVRAAPI